MVEDDLKVGADVTAFIAPTSGIRSTEAQNQHVRAVGVGFRLPATDRMTVAPNVVERCIRYLVAVDNSCSVRGVGGVHTICPDSNTPSICDINEYLYLLEQVYVTAHCVHLVMDNLNTHFRKCFEDALGVKEAKALLRRVVYHYTPKHASWLNMAESKSVSWIASVWISACQTAPSSLPKLTPGSSAETTTSEVSRGRSLGRTPLKKWCDIMFRN